MERPGATSGVEEPAPRALLARLRGGGLRATLLTGAGGALVTNVAGAGLGFLAHVALARALGVAAYGVFVAVTAWMTVLTLGAKLGFDTVLLRWVPTYRARGDWRLLKGLLRTGAVFVVATSASLSLVAGAVLFALRERLAAGELATFALALGLLPLLALTSLRQGALQGLKRVVLAQLPERIVRPVLLGLGVLLLARASDGPIGAPAAMAVALGAAGAAFALGSLALARALPPEVRRAEPERRAREWAGAALAFVLISGSSLVLNQTDIIMVRWLQDPEAAGVYGAVSRVSTLVGFALVAMNAIAAPLIAELWSTGRRAELQRLATFAARCVFAATALLVLLLAALGRPTLALFGDDFPAGYGPLLVLAAGQATSALVGSVGLLLSMTGHQKEAARIMLAAALANVVLNALLIPRLGLLGAAVATAATTAAWNLAMLVRVVRTLGIDPTVLRIRTRRDPSAGDPHP